MPYPVTLHIAGKSVVVVGGGMVAARKIRRLVAEDARVTVISPQLNKHINHNKIAYLQAEYAFEHLRDCRPALVFAATDDPEVNRQVAADAAMLGAWVNVIDGVAPSDFDNVMSLERSPLQVTVASGGEAPMLAKQLRDDIDALLGDAYPKLAAWMGELREPAKSVLPTPEARRDFWAAMLATNVLDLLKANKVDEARATLQRFAARYGIAW